MSDYANVNFLPEVDDRVAFKFQGSFRARGNLNIGTVVRCSNLGNLRLERDDRGWDILVGSRESFQGATFVVRTKSGSRHYVGIHMIKRL